MRIDHHRLQVRLTPELMQHLHRQTQGGSLEPYSVYLRRLLAEDMELAQRRRPAKEAA